MWIIPLIGLVWFVGAVLSQVYLRCSEKLQRYNDSLENALATIFWPATIVYALAMCLYKGVNVVATKLEKKLCPNQTESRR